MIDELTAPNLAALRRALCGTYRMTVSDDVVILYASLPGDCPAAATRLGGVVWVVVDLDKPRAIRHARAMIDDYRERQAASVDLGDDDLNRELQRAFGLPALDAPAIEGPLPVKAVG